MTSPIRVIIADDHPFIRKGMQQVLAREADIQLVGEASTGAEAIEVVGTIMADVLLLDLSMPGLTTLEIIEAVCQLNPALKILIVSAHDEEGVIQRVVRAGVMGYILKDEAESLLSHGVRTVHQGAMWFSESVMQSLMMPPSPSTLLTELSVQEREILQAFAQGLSNKEVAIQLHFSRQTVRNYSSRLYEKLGVTSRAEAVVWACQNGLTD